MTVLEATGELYRWFGENDTFNLDEDFTKIVIVTDHPKRDKATFLCALDQFEEINFISSSSIEDVKYWILKKPFHTYNQTVEVSPELSMTVAEIINKFCTITEDVTFLCDPMNIKEDDLKNVIYIANLALAEKIVDQGGE